jgi:hypothetical protein
MKVRVKDGEKGFYDGKIRREGEIFNIEAKTHSTQTDDKGDPVVITEDQQFSGKWMEKVEAPKPKRGPKPKAASE